MAPKSDTTFNSKSSFTADGVAYRRTFTDIPLSKEIWNAYESIYGKRSPDELEHMKMPSTAAFFEGRYVLDDMKIKESGASQIFELASGLSSRGMTMTVSADAVYVELDLPEKMSAKRQIVQKLMTDGIVQERPNLFLEEGNVLDKADFDRASKHFHDRPIAVVCEGLLRYLSFADKKRVALMIRDLLLRHGGVWITPDIDSAQWVPQSPEQQKRSEKLQKQTGIDISTNLFKDEKEATVFFEKLGFSIEKFRISTVADRLTCPQRLGITPEMVKKALDTRWMFVMKAKI
jgi:hypothetical protein